MAKYVYPAIFTCEEGGQFSIRFPDVENCYTCGDSLEDGIEMAEDVLALRMYEYETAGRPIPTPGARERILLAENEFVNYVRCDTMEYRRRFASHAVKKTLTIPEWMNEEGVRRGLNFSQILQDALLQKLGNV